MKKQLTSGTASLRVGITQNQLIKLCNRKLVPFTKRRMVTLLWEV